MNFQVVDEQDSVKVLAFSEEEDSAFCYVPLESVPSEGDGQEGDMP